MEPPRTSLGGWIEGSIIILLFWVKEKINNSRKTVNMILKLNPICKIQVFIYFFILDFLPGGSQGLNTNNTPSSNNRKKQKSPNKYFAQTLS